MNVISPLAIVECQVVADNVTVHPFAVIRSGVMLGDGVVIHPHTVIESGVTLGDNVEVFPGAYIGKKPKGAGALAKEHPYREIVIIGDNCSIGPGAIIYYDVRIGRNTLIGDGAAIREDVQIGEFCIVGRYVSIHANVTIGSRTRLMDFSAIVGNSTLGDDVFVSLNVTTTNDNYFGDRGYDESFIQGPKIGNRARIGASVTLLPNVVIGDGAVIAASSLVTKDVAAQTTVIGQPARSR